MRSSTTFQVPSVQTLIDVRTMNFLGHLLQGHVDLPPRQVLVAWVYNTRPIGRPLKSNRESMWQSLRRMMEDVSYVNIDFVGSLKDFYLFALDKAWWQKLIDRLLDPEVPIPARPNDGFTYNPRRSRRNQSQQSQPQSQSSPRSQRSSTNHVSPPGRNRNRSRRNRPRAQRNEESTEPNSGRSWRPENIGNVLYDSLKIFDLSYSATYPEVKARYRSLASRYHPDKHSIFGGEGEGRTGMTLEETSAFFQHLNNAHQYLKEKL